MFLVKNFPMGQRVLVDSSFGQPAAQGDGKKEEVTRQGELPLVKEVLLVALGNRQSRPYLLVRGCRRDDAGVGGGTPGLPAERQRLSPPRLLTGPRGAGAAHLRGLQPRLPAGPEQPQSPV